MSRAPGQRVLEDDDALAAAGQSIASPSSRGRETQLHKMTQYKQKACLPW